MVLSTALKKSTGRPRKGEEGKAVMSEEDVKKFAHQHEEMFFSSKPKQLVHWSNPQKENSSEIRTGFVIGISLQSKLAFGQPIHALVWIRRILTCHFSFLFFFLKAQWTFSIQIIAHAYLADICNTKIWPSSVFKWHN